MAKTYVISKLWRVIGVASLPITLGTSVWVLLKLTQQFYDKLYIPIIVAILAILVILYVLTDVIAIFKTKLTIREHELEITQHETQVIVFDQIKGYEIGKNYIYLVLKNETLSKVPISLYIEKRPEWFGFIATKFIDLDDAEFEKEIDALLLDENYGLTKDERSKNILVTLNRTRVFNWFGIVVTLWLFFAPYPEKWAVIFGIAIPLIAVVWVIMAGGGIRILSDNESPYPSLNSAIAFPVLGLFVLAISKYTLVDNTLVWLYSFPIAIMLAYLLIKRLPQELAPTSRLDSLIVYPLLAGFSCLYLYSTITLINCAFDNNESTIITGQLVSKQIKKEDAYKLTLEIPNHTRSYTLNTSQIHYESIQPGDEVFVEKYTGTLSFPWIRLIVVEQTLP